MSRPSARARHSSGERMTATLRCPVLEHQRELSPDANTISCETPREPESAWLKPAADVHQVVLDFGNTPPLLGEHRGDCRLT